jgi:putative membrane protein
MFIMIFFLIALIVGIIYFFKSSWWPSGNAGTGSIHEDSPLDILKKRYAKSEIDKEELERMKKDLGY